jgi:hypothetical protein
MSRRGLIACESEWLLACAAHNLPKLHRHHIQANDQRPIPSSQDLKSPKTAAPNLMSAHGIPDLPCQTAEALAEEAVPATPATPVGDLSMSGALVIEHELTALIVARRRPASASAGFPIGFPIFV